MTETGKSQYLTFSLGAESYGLDILKVQEIKGYTFITPIPNTAPHILGAMNLRGTVIPVLDLRARFELPPTEHTKFTVIIVVKINQRIAGLVVDSVSEVVDLGEGDVRPPPEFGIEGGARFLEGMVANQDKLITLLDIEKLFDESDTAAADGRPKEDSVEHAER
jgi:purine-binding chemotaxis protein CheW